MNWVVCYYARRWIEAHSLLASHTKGCMCTSPWYDLTWRKRLTDHEWWDPLIFDVIVGEVVDACASNFISSWGYEHLVKGLFYIFFFIYSFLDRWWLNSLALGGSECFISPFLRLVPTRVRKWLLPLEI